MVKEESADSFLLRTSDFDPPMSGFRPAIDTPRATPFSTFPTDARTQGFLRLVKSSSADDDFNFASTLEHKEKLGDIRAAPLFSNRVRLALDSGYMRRMGAVDPIAFPQYGLLGTCQQFYGNERLKSEVLPVEDNFLMVNMNTPWSAFVCGSQGSGKSHTLSYILESALLTSSSAGENPEPLAGLVFHYDHFTSQESAQLCEAAYLCSSGVPVRVLVSPSNYAAMHHLYSNLPGLPETSPKPQVVPLYIKEEHLNVSRMMTLMNMNNVENPPLYMEVLYQILRDMAMDNNGSPGVDYADFSARLDKQGFNEMQNGPLNLRLQLLEAFLAHRDQSTESSALLDDYFKSAQGTLTIVDLSCPFVNENDASIDEAHKFLTKTGEAKRLTEQLVSLIRQQRHLSTRVVIATQEPTLSSQLIDLCNICIVHRFNSPAWFSVLRDHLAGANASSGGGKAEAPQLFVDIVALRTGEAFVFCPTALMDVVEGQMVNLQNGFIRVKIRPRCSVDGGRSILASDRASLINIQPRRVSDIVRPYPRRENVRTKRSRGERGGSSTTTAMLDTSIPEVVYSTPPVSTPPAPVNPPAVQRPVVSAASQLFQTKAEKKIILNALRDETIAFLRAHPHSLTYHEVRRSVAASLNLPNGFFNELTWVQLSKNVVKEQAVCCF
ncbi:hypothetical protein LTR84_005293 [Exophiala bonariae]|uniref:Uncharacterized protein n=1 Tax=Exophiala bonariae TaxID=1690606 RepID=A0AAV9NPD0_9EURO|nr:hypothetical protein LTR84_005293 [Exophiala bonariae]